MSRTPKEHLAEISALFTNHSLNHEHIPVAEALGRRTADAVHAKWDSPRFDNSQMDGFALSAAHLEGGTFPVGPTIPAGTDPQVSYPHGLGQEIAPIMTGAKLPEHTAAIVPVEKTNPGTFEAERVTIPPTLAGQFLRLQGSDISAGTEIIPADTELNSVHIAVLASQSISRVTVWKKPRVILITGGAEITSTPGVATIPDANGPLLRALCERNGIEVAAQLQTNDDPQRLRNDVEDAIDHHQPDAIITSGGISHGKFEVVRQLLSGEPKSWFGHVNQQPGGPQGQALLRNIPVISLPGNPISTLVSFTLFAAPAINCQKLLAIYAHLSETTTGLQDDREVFLRGTHKNTDGRLVATPLQGTSSHLLVQATTADCLIRIPARTTVKANDLVQIYPIS